MLRDICQPKKNITQSNEVRVFGSSITCLTDPIVQQEPMYV